MLLSISFVYITTKVLLYYFHRNCTVPGVCALCLPRYLSSCRFIILGTGEKLINAMLQTTSTVNMAVQSLVVN